MAQSLVVSERRVPTVPGWTGFYIGKGIVRYRLRDPGRIVLDATDLLTEIHVPKSHRLLRLELKQTTSADADSNDSLTVRVSKRHVTENLVFDFIRVQDWVLEQSAAILFGEGYEYAATHYTLLTNGTNTNRIYPELYIQYLGDD